MPSLFEMPVTNVRGVGAAAAELLRKLSIYSVGQLLCYYPRTYEDWSNPVPLTPFLEGQALIKARLTTAFATSRLSGGRILSNAEISDDTGSLSLVYFNNKYKSHHISK